jgi:hypothetical protein
MKCFRRRRAIAVLPLVLLVTECGKRSDSGHTGMGAIAGAGGTVDYEVEVSARILFTTG